MMGMMYIKLLTFTSLYLIISIKMRLRYFIYNESCTKILLLLQGTFSMIIETWQTDNSGLPIGELKNINILFFENVCYMMMMMKPHV